MCDDYEKARVLDLCEAMPPVYVATDDDDPAFVAHLKSRGCFLSSDLKLGAPRHTLTDVDLLMVDVMLVAGAEVSLTFGHTALARLYDRIRAARGTPRSINVAADAAFKRRTNARLRARARAPPPRRWATQRIRSSSRGRESTRTTAEERRTDARIEPTAAMASGRAGARVAVATAVRLRTSPRRRLTVVCEVSDSYRRSDSCRRSSLAPRDRTSSSCSSTRSSSSSRSRSQSSESRSVSARL